VKLFRRASAFAAGVALVAMLCNTLPASAQVWGYSPYSGSSNWLSLARGLSYPLNRMSGSSTPFYLGSNLIYAGTYAAARVFRGNARQGNMGNYSDQEPYYDPRQRTRPNYSGGYGTSDQIVHATWKQQQQQLGLQPQEDDDVPVPQQANQSDWLTQPIQPAADPDPSSLGVANNGAPHVVASPGAVSDKMPPTAPTLPPRQVQASEPLAMGFVQVINERFNGDVAAALHDKDLRKYARSVGLIDSEKAPSDNMSREKSDLIRAILADQNESASVKINAVRVLLKH
jgi:hypothetical protein